MNGNDSDKPAINAGRLKHLEMSQAVVSRMASNSFLIKGWSVTLLSAVLALALKDKIDAMAAIGFVPVVMFWALDGWFLRQERLFRKLWDVRRVEAQHLVTDFDMDTTSFDAGVPPWHKIAFSSTLLAFHGALFTVLVLALALAVVCMRGS